jgi:hypothetical protein
MEAQKKRSVKEIMAEINRRTTALQHAFYHCSQSEEKGF